MPRARLRKRLQRPALCIDHILSWADAWFAAHRRWPNVKSGFIPRTIDDTWARIDDSLRHGYRGLPVRLRLSLAKPLEKRRGVRNSEYPPSLTTGQVITWAKSHRKRTGDFPLLSSGPVVDAPGETWLAIDMALRKGRRCLPGGSSLARLLADRCGVRIQSRLPRLAAHRPLGGINRVRRRAYPLSSAWRRQQVGVQSELPRSAGEVS